MSNGSGSGLGLLGLLIAIPLIAQVIRQTERIGEQVGFKENKKKGGKND